MAWATLQDIQLISFHAGIPVLGAPFTAELHADPCAPSSKRYEIRGIPYEWWQVIETPPFYREEREREIRTKLEFARRLSLAQDDLRRAERRLRDLQHR